MPRTQTPRKTTRVRGPPLTPKDISAAKTGVIKAPLGLCHRHLTREETRSLPYPAHVLSIQRRSTLTESVRTPLSKEFNGCLRNLNVTVYTLEEPHAF